MICNVTAIPTRTKNILMQIDFISNIEILSVNHRKIIDPIFVVLGIAL
ncbi:hypothetical protein [Paraclostridium bifermentans]|nr:hypothetical protein [Paraclostridium bifermentans]MBZ6005509.1 hypothetical protein [Paraclostridium bifermentans]